MSRTNNLINQKYLNWPAVHSCQNNKISEQLARPGVNAKRGTGFTFLTQNIDLLLTIGEASAVSALSDIVFYVFAVFLAIELLDHALGRKLRLKTRV